jgi:hypothetical protein
MNDNISIFSKTNKPLINQGLIKFNESLHSDPKGIRTPTASVKGW